jgi:hypothetical protein
MSRTTAIPRKLAVIESSWSIHVFLEVLHVVIPGMQRRNTRSLGMALNVPEAVKRISLSFSPMLVYQGLHSLL